MENASRALLMGAEVLIGVLILSIGVYIYNMFSAYSAETEGRMFATQTEQYNAAFLQYLGYMQNPDYNGSPSQPDVIPIKATAHDIISCANKAYQRNYAQGFYDDINLYNSSKNPKDGKSEYVRIDIKLGGAYNISNFEHRADPTNDSVYQNFLKEKSTDNEGNPIYYKCTEAAVSKTSGRVIYMEFSPYDSPRVPTYNSY